MKSEGWVVNVLKRNEYELEVLCNLGGINLLEDGESITEEYKKLRKQDHVKFCLNVQVTLSVPTWPQ